MAATNKAISQISNLKQRKFLFTFLVFFLVVVLLWVMISLFSTQNTLKISTELKNLAKPLTPSVDAAVLDDLEQKQIYSADDLKNFDIYMIEEDEKDKSSIRVVKIGATKTDL